MPHLAVPEALRCIVPNRSTIDWNTLKVSFTVKTQRMHRESAGENNDALCELAAKTLPLCGENIFLISCGQLWYGGPIPLQEVFMINPFRKKLLTGLFNSLNRKFGFYFQVMVARLIIWRVEKQTRHSVKWHVVKRTGVKYTG